MAKKKLSIKTLLLSIIAFGGLSINLVFAQDGALLFKQKCASCHSIGSGKLVGPDLKNVTKKRDKVWLTKFIQSSSSLIKSGDPEAVAVFKEFNNSPMNDFPLTQDEITKILEFIGAGKVESEKIDPKKIAEQQFADSILKADNFKDLMIGKDLFYGQKRFKNGGTSCASCHNACYNGDEQGGKLAKDLTNAFKRLGGYAGIKGILNSPPYPSMTETYKVKSLTEPEMAYLLLFLKSTDTKNNNGPMKLFDIMIIIGSILSVFVAIMIIILWRNRKKQSVNASIYKRQTKYSI
jgi:cytochrome c2